jgi:hypothetical protein
VYRLPALRAFWISHLLVWNRCAGRQSSARSTLPRVVHHCAPMASLLPAGSGGRRTSPTPQEYMKYPSSKPLTCSRFPGERALQLPPPSPRLQFLLTQRSAQEYPP